MRHFYLQLTSLGAVYITQEEDCRQVTCSYCRGSVILFIFLLHYISISFCCLMTPAEISESHLCSRLEKRIMVTAVLFSFARKAKNSPKFQQNLANAWLTRTSCLLKLAFLLACKGWLLNFYGLYLPVFNHEWLEINHIGSIYISEIGYMS